MIHPLVLVFCVFFSLYAGPSEAEENAPAGRHAELACADCHPASFRESRACSECHEPSDNLHPDRVRPMPGQPAAFPLQNGLVSCRTCHRLHEPTGPHALRGFREGVANQIKDFCASCHGEHLSETNPHRADAGQHRCAFCHASLDIGSVLAGEGARARARADRLCDFCHDVRARNHPRNIDPVLDLPDDLPRGAGGEVTCITCHNPHGSSTFTHYVREGYALHFERGRQENPHRNDRFACRACHVNPSPEELTTASHELRFNGDAILLCVSCHVTARSHHPVGTPLDPSMETRLAVSGRLPLDDMGRTTCVTCHTNNCASDRQQMSIRHYDAQRMRLDLCWRCHAKDTFVQTDPHRKTVDDTTDGCVYCHDRPPVKGLEQSSELYFISQVKMICIRCHENLSDQDVSHMGKIPTPDTLARLESWGEKHATSFPLDDRGALTCTTCHNAHFSAKESRHKTRLPSMQMCALCHRR